MAPAGRRALTRVARLVPDAVETISYGMPGNPSRARAWSLKVSTRIGCFLPDRDRALFAAVDGDLLEEVALLLGEREHLCHLDSDGLEAVRRPIGQL
jgi:hypothetical protein